MKDALPRIRSVKPQAPGLNIRWEGDGTDFVDLTGWIETGGEILQPLAHREFFDQARVGPYGTSVVWDDDDIAIDSEHLRRIADLQRSFESADLKEWQKAMDLSNNEAADVLGISLSTYNSYKAGAVIPDQIAVICRLALGDPLIMHARFRRRITGRPRKETVS